MAGKRDLFEQAMTRGHSAAWDQQWDKAMAYYRAALTEFPDDPKALTSLGFAMLQADRPEEALAVYQRAAALTPRAPRAPEKCGEIFERLVRLNGASQAYIAVAEGVVPYDSISPEDGASRIQDHMVLDRRMALGIGQVLFHEQGAKCDSLVDFDMVAN